MTDNKPKEVTRDKEIRVFVSAEERIALRVACAQDGELITDWVRDAIEQKLAIRKHQ